MARLCIARRSNHSPAPHGGFNLLCGAAIRENRQEIFLPRSGKNFPQQEVVAMPWAARAGVDPRRGSFFVHNNMGNLLLGRDGAPAAKTEFRAIWRNRSLQTCSGDLAWPEFGAATLVNVGGAVWMELFALESSGAYLKSIALRVTKYWLRRRASLMFPNRRAFLSARREISPATSKV